MLVLNHIKHISHQIFLMMNSPRLIGATVMSGDGSDETSAAWERVNGDMSPGSSHLVQDAVSDPLRAATRFAAIFTSRDLKAKEPELVYA